MGLYFGRGPSWWTAPIGSLTHAHAQLQRAGGRAQHVGGSAAVKAGSLRGQIAQGEDDAAVICPARKRGRARNEARK